MKDPIGQIKAWLFPSVITLLAGIIWNDVQEIKADIKQLMAQSNIDKTRIDNLERLIYKSTEPLKTSFNDHQQIMAILPINSFEIKQKKENEKVL
ncbi:MAG: hypothetical protein EBR30_01840 [Cytophagia bacterium]|nr:hypothetical protein [Cytophagia bacterium]